MKKYLFLIIIALLGWTSTFANGSDTIYVKPWSLTQEEFIQKYGQKDSDRAIINLFFRKRTNAIIEFGLTVPIPILSTVLAERFDEINNSSKYEFAARLFYAAGVVLTQVLFYDAIIKEVGYPKRKLYTILEQHRKGIPYPIYITKRLRDWDFEVPATDNP